MDGGMDGGLELKKHILVTAVSSFLLILCPLQSFFEKSVENYFLFKNEFPFYI